VYVHATMTSNPNSSRRYTDEEVRKLLKRASELESQGGTLPAPIEGPTLSDLEAIASEAGINPTLVRQAARELDTPSSGLRAMTPQTSGILRGSHGFRAGADGFWRGLVFRP